MGFPMPYGPFNQKAPRMNADSMPTERLLADLISASKINSSAA